MNWENKKTSNNPLIDVGHVTEINVGFTKKLIKDKHSILDIGCGNGVYAKAIFKQNNLSNKTKWTGVDINPSFIKVAKKLLPSNKFIVADARSYLKKLTLNTSNNKFDVILISSVLQYFTKPECVKLLKECMKLSHNILIPGVLNEETFKKAHPRFSNEKLLFHNLFGGSITYLTEQFFIDIVKNNRASVKFTYNKRAFKQFNVLIEKVV